MQGMSALLSKALLLARGHARRLIRGPASPPPPAIGRADVTRFEVPRLPDTLTQASRQQLIDWQGQVCGDSAGKGAGWINDFVNSVGQSDKDRNPNSKIRIKL